MTKSEFAPIHPPPEPALDHLCTMRAVIYDTDQSRMQTISGRIANSTKHITPRIIALGGDHTTTLAALRSTFERWGPVSVIHFDSHLGKCQG